MSESRRVSGFPILIATIVIFANARILSDDGIPATRTADQLRERAAGKAASYVLTIPEIDLGSESDVPLWRQYCERRIDQFELAARGEDGHEVKRTIEPVVVDEQRGSSKRLVYLWTHLAGERRQNKCCEIAATPFQPCGVQSGPREICYIV